MEREVLRSGGQTIIGFVVLLIIAIWLLVANFGAFWMTLIGLLELILFAVGAVFLVIGITDWRGQAQANKPAPATSPPPAAATDPTSGTTAEV